MEKQKGMQRVFVITICGIILLALAALVYAFSYQRSLQRDATRLDVIRQAEAAFQKVYLLNGSYQAAAKSGCDKVGAALTTCNFSSVSVDASTLRDPGKSGMTISDVPSKDGYEVAFTLERRRGNLTQGTHTLTPQGIR